MSKEITLSLTLKQAFVVLKTSTAKKSRRLLFDSIDLNEKIYAQIADQIDKSELQEVTDEWKKLPPCPESYNEPKPRVCPKCHKEGVKKNDKASK